MLMYKPVRSTTRPRAQPVTEPIDVIAAGISEWANKAFPGRTDQGMYLKMYSEIAEMIDADDAHVGDEIADVFIMLLDFAHRKGVNIEQAIATKMATNRERVWAKNKLGAWSHVKR